MPCGRKRRRARAQDPLVAVGGQLHFQVDLLNTREDVQLNSNNKDFFKKKTRASHISYARSFLNCRQVCSEAPVEEQVSKSTIPVVGDRNSSANGKILKSMCRGWFPCLCVSAPPEVPSSCSQGCRAGGSRTVSSSCAGNARNHSHHQIFQGGI